MISTQFYVIIFELQTEMCIAAHPHTIFKKYLAVYSVQQGEECLVTKIASVSLSHTHIMNMVSMFKCSSFIRFSFESVKLRGWSVCTGLRSGCWTVWCGCSGSLDTHAERWTGKTQPGTALNDILY